MHDGRYGKRRRPKKRYVLIAACLILTAILGTLGTVAFLMQISDQLVNTFNLVGLPNEVVEDFDGSIKENVGIRNTTTGDEPAYIRTAVVVNWVNPDTGDVYAAKPVENTDYVMTWYDDIEPGTAYTDPDTGEVIDMTAGEWILGSDGYYYFTMPVESGDMTQYLFTNCKLKEDANVPDGYVLSVTIAGQSIQANGVDSDGNRPVVLAWGIASGGSVSSVNETQFSLNIQTS